MLGSFKATAVPPPHPNQRLANYHRHKHVAKGSGSIIG